MIPIWYSVALGSILSISIAGAPAQYNPHLGLSKQDQDALAAHHLTVQNVRQMFAVDRDLLKLLKKVPDLDARAAELERRFDSQRLGIVVVGAKVYEAMPEIAQILRKHNISGSDYLLTKITAMIAEISDGASAAEALAVGAPQREGTNEGFLGPAVKFWSEMDPALKAEAAEWTHVRDELAKLGRHKVW